MRGLGAVLWDIRFQFRHGFYGAYGFVCAVYIGLLRFLPESMEEEAVRWIIFTDPSLLGVFFVGGMILLERRQGVLVALAVTPLRLWEQLTAKVLSLMLLAVASSVIILVGAGWWDINWLPVLIGIMATSAFTTLAGVSLAVRVRSLNGYLLATPLIAVFFLLPAPAWVGLMDAGWFILLPAQAGWTLLAGGWQPLTPATAWGSLAVLCGWIVVAARVAVRSYRIHLLREKGEHG